MANSPFFKYHRHRRAHRGGTLVGGSDTFNVGATLSVGGTQAAGLYSGPFTVTVSYN